LNWNHGFFVLNFVPFLPNPQTNCGATHLWLKCGRPGRTPINLSLNRPHLVVLKRTREYKKKQRRQRKKEQQHVSGFDAHMPTTKLFDPTLTTTNVPWGINFAIPVGFNNG
jgi:hypothetical protein